MNPFSRSTRRPDLLASESGQMAVFIALIFQVLFVFFAMVVNIGLIIHDKINLQNSVDLGAYYAAAKMAEQMNEIAHINYQIRQDYKLLAYRIRVLGTFGSKRAGQSTSLHPLFMAAKGSPQPDSPFTDAGDIRYFNDFPSICVMHASWTETANLARGGTGENLCLQMGGQIPPLPNQPVIFPSPGNILISQKIADFKAAFRERCDQAGPLNWRFAAQIDYGYRKSVAYRKDMIHAIENNLSLALRSDQQGVMRDRNNDPVAAGMEQTIRKNLTKANLASVVSIEGLNGLGAGGCNQAMAEGSKKWLREILVAPTVTYAHFDPTGGGCRYETRTIQQPAGSFTMFDPTGELYNLTRGEPPPNVSTHSSRGFEKNPWCLAYAGVKAITQPRKPFAPFGAAITLTARSFAMPFGGRIGPWDKNRWDRNSEYSSNGELVDPLSVPRMIPPAFFNPADPLNVPNYSRYPGDPDGLKSRMAMAMTMPSVRAVLPGVGTAKFTMGHYDSLITSMQGDGDVLAWDSETGTPSASRMAERAAVAPDLFDATYYSIDPNYYSYYFNTINANRFQGLPRMPDVGARTDANNFKTRTIKDQITDIFVNGEGSVINASGGSYWMLRNPTHLLTGWLPKAPNDFSFPTDAFGKCQLQPNTQKDPATMGDCIVGGRSGYSVELVSQDYLMSDKHKLGGTNSSPGQILNLPNGF